MTWCRRAVRGGIEEFVLGMAHRGRLNVLVNVLGKSPADLFSEFEGKYDRITCRDRATSSITRASPPTCAPPGGNVHVVLAFNPSHLEIVDPVVEGSVRARQERRGDTQGDKVVPILMHGDAAFAGQGVVMETLQMSQTRGYRTGGTIHIVINNQVGFTTSDPRDARSTTYCSDVAKMIEAPILHVNADDPEAVIFVHALALRYRQRFHKDVVIDLVCYRRLGHNEADEPAAPSRSCTAPSASTRRCASSMPSSLAAGVLTRGRCRADGRAVPPGARCGQLRAASRARDDRQQVHGRLVALPRRSIGPSAHRVGVPTGAARARGTADAATRRICRCIRAWRR